MQKIKAELDYDTCRETLAGERCWIDL